MSRKILKSNGAFVLIGDSPSWKTTDETGRLFSLVQNTNFSLTNERQQLKQVGSQAYSVNHINRSPNINLTIDYYLSPYLNNEFLLGFAGKTSYEQNFLEKTFYGNFSDNNFYIIINNIDGEDAISEARKKSPQTINFSGYDVLSFGNCYLTNYQLAFSLGSVPVVSTSYSCSNMKVDNLVNSSRFEIVNGSFTWSGAKADAESKGGRLAVLNTEEKQNKVPEYSSSALWIGANDATVEGVWKWIDGTLLNDGYTNWRPGEPNNAGGNEDYAARDYLSPYQWNDVSNTSNRGYIIEYIDNILTIPAINHQSGNANNAGLLNLSASTYPILSGHIDSKSQLNFDISNLPVTTSRNSTFTLQNLQVGGIPLSKSSDPVLQNLNINLDFNRTDLYGLGSNYVYDRKLNYPVVGTVEIEALVSGFNSGFISGIVNNESDYSFEIQFTNPTNVAATGIYRFSRAKLENFNYSMAVNNTMTFNASFSVEILSNTGFSIGRYIQNADNWAVIQEIWQAFDINWQ